MITLGENEVMKRLAAYGALVTVPTLIAGIYGMNFKVMPELQWVYGYPIALFLMFGIDALLFFKFRKTGWL
jgi:magnesium transporter